MVAVSLKKNFFQAEDGIRDVERSRGLGDVYKRQIYINLCYINQRFVLDESFRKFYTMSNVDVYKIKDARPGNFSAPPLIAQNTVI